MAHGPTAKSGATTKFEWGERENKRPSDASRGSSRPPATAPCTGHHLLSRLQQKIHTYTCSSLLTTIPRRRPTTRQP